MQTKKCSTCRAELPVASFGRNAHRYDGLQTKCRECHRLYQQQHYVHNKAKYLARAYKQHSEYTAWWHELKASYACTACGEAHVACIQFHHDKGDKLADIAALINKRVPKARVLSELAKCTPLCANCHAKLHWRARQT